MSLLFLQRRPAGHGRVPVVPKGTGKQPHLGSIFRIGSRKSTPEAQLLEFSNILACTRQNQTNELKQL